MKLYLDPKLIIALRDLINSSNYYYESMKNSNKWNLICAFMDRIEDSVSHINELEFSESTKSGMGNIIILFVYVDILRVGISELNDSLNLEIDHDEFDGYFQHLRKLVYAHSLNSKFKSKWQKKGELLYTPFVDDNFDPHMIHIEVYSNIRKSEDVRIKLLKKDFFEYVTNKYNVIEIIAENLKKLEIEYLSSGQKIINYNHININETIDNLIIEYKRRYENSIVIILELFKDIYNFEDLIEKNKELVMLFKKDLIKHFKEFVDSTNSLDEKIYEHKFLKLFDIHIPTDKPIYNYYVEKSILYLKNISNNLEIGSKSFKLFYEDFLFKFFELHDDLTNSDKLILMYSALYENFTYENHTTNTI